MTIQAKTRVMQPQAKKCHQKLEAREGLSPSHLRKHSPAIMLILIQEK